MASPHPSDEDEDDALGLTENFYKEMDALKRACQVRDQYDGSGDSDDTAEDDEDSDEDVLRSVQKKLAPFSWPGLTPRLLPLADECEEDEDDILISVQKYCGALGTETSEAAGEGGPSGGADDGSPETAIVVPEEKRQAASSGLLLPANLRALFIALNKNRSCQRQLRSLAHQVEVKHAENKLLQRRVKAVIANEKAIQKRFTGLFSSRLSNPFLSFINNLKRRGSRKRNEHDDQPDAGIKKPPSNPDVAKYRELNRNLPLTFSEKKWTAEEKVELWKGLKQQIQQTYVRQAMDTIRLEEQDVSMLTAEVGRISEMTITPKHIEQALPTLNWDDVSRLYVVGRSAAECKLQWMNCEDPAINRGPWSKPEDKKLLLIAQEHNLYNWELVAKELGTNRTPAQCFSRFQRSLNAGIMKSAWTVEEDAQLRAAVNRLGENDWQTVAANMEGRTGPQCSNRWYKVLHPAIRRKGKWQLEEDKRLKWAVSVYGAQKWSIISNHVPGRTGVQCRERWVNVLDPSVNTGSWTSDEDRKLEELVAKYGEHRWAKVAKGIDFRTDSQCWRRWKNLHPENQASFHQDLQIKRKALISNFVGRVKERPRLGPRDFIDGEATDQTGARNVSNQAKRKRKKRCTAIVVTNDGGEAQEDPAIAATAQNGSRGSRDKASSFVSLVQAFDTFCKCAGKFRPTIVRSGGEQLDRRNQPEQNTRITRGPEAADDIDAEVAAATRAVLSWPFAVGVTDVCAAAQEASTNKKSGQNLQSAERFHQQCVHSEDLDSPGAGAPSSSKVFEGGARKRRKLQARVPLASNSEDIDNQSPCSEDLNVSATAVPARKEAHELGTGEDVGLAATDVPAGSGTPIAVTREGCRAQAEVARMRLLDGQHTLHDSSASAVDAPRRESLKARARKRQKVETQMLPTTNPQDRIGNVSRAKEKVTRVVLDHTSLEILEGAAQETEVAHLNATPQVEVRNRRRKRVGSPCARPDDGGDADGLAVRALQTGEGHGLRKYERKKKLNTLSTLQLRQDEVTEVETRNEVTEGGRRKKLGMPAGHETRKYERKKNLNTLSTSQPHQDEVTEVEIRTDVTEGGRGKRLRKPTRRLISSIG